MILFFDFLIYLYMKIIRQKNILVFLVTADKTEDLASVVNELVLLLKTKREKQPN